MKKRLLVPLIPVAACLAFTAPALAADNESVSENWAGYEVTTNSGTGFSAASGGWTEPTVNCTAGESSYSAFWVGLGGGDESSDALEQEGTQADCTADGKAEYYAWYELVPSAPVKLSLKISPGDQIYARTAVSGDQVTVEVVDKTTGQSFDKTLTMTDATPDTSTAEWVAEAPSDCSNGTLSNCSVLPLSDFGTVKFTDAYATSDGHTGAISDSNWTATPIALESAAGSFFGGGYGGYTSGYGYGSAGYGDGDYSDSSSSTGDAAPSSLSDNGSSFSVTYGAAATSAEQGSSSSETNPSSDYGYGGGYGGSSGDYPGGYSSGYGDGYGGYGGYGGGYGYASGGYGGYGGGYGSYYYFSL